MKLLQTTQVRKSNKKLQGIKPVVAELIFKQPSQGLFEINQGRSTFGIKIKSLDLGGWFYIQDIKDVADRKFIELWPMQEGILVPESSHE